MAAAKAPVKAKLAPKPAARRGRVPVIAAKLQEIKEHVNETGDADSWYIVREYETRRGADSALYRIQRGETAVPPGHWEFETRIVDESSSLYAQFRPRRSGGKAKGSV